MMIYSALLQMGLLACGVADETLQSSKLLERSPYWLHPDKACGPLCVTFVEKLLRNRSNYAEISRLCPPGPEGTTLNVLAATIRTLGLYATGFRSDTGQLKGIPGPSIIHCTSESEKGTMNHFIVLLSWDSSSKTFQVYDPPGELKKLSFSELDSMYSGVGIQCGRRPSSIFRPAWWVFTLKVVVGIIVFFGALAVMFLLRNKVRIKRGPTVSMLAKNLSLIGASILLYGCSRQAPVNSSQAARGIPPYKADMGVVRQGDPIKHSFEILNTTPRVLHVASTAYS